MEPTMNGKIVLITGATSGIGKATAISLAKLGARVIFTTRDMKRGAQAKKEIIDASQNKEIDYLYCDLASIESVRSFVNEFKQRYSWLHVLINNAGVWNHKRRNSKDGIEETFAVNYLAPFLMTSLLLDTLKKSKPSRIVNLTSRLHGGPINFQDIEFKKSYSGRKAYSQSKLAMILFTRILAKRLEGTGITANCVHPGLVSTNISRDSDFISKAFFRAFGKTPENGAKTSIYVASAPELSDVSGEYFEDMNVKKTEPHTYNLETAKRLWNTGVSMLRDKSK